MDPEGTAVALDWPLLEALSEVGPAVRLLAEAGVDGLFTFEGPNDVFAPLVAAGVALSTHERRGDVDLYSNIAVAFPRSAAHLATIAWDLQRLSHGRFSLGLGSQIRAHVERRYGSNFDRPAPRMADTVRATRAFFAAFQDGVALDHRGEFRAHSLLPPLFNPGPLASGPPPILVAAVGPLMTKVATTEADGILLHPFTSERHLVDRVLPVIAEGRREADPRTPFDVVAGVIVATGTTDRERHDAREAARALVAFYGSTPAYRAVLDHHGRGDLQPELRRATRAGRWDQLPDLVTDELLDLLTVSGDPDAVGRALAGRARVLAAGGTTRLAVSLPLPVATTTAAAVIDAFGRHNV